MTTIVYQANDYVGQLGSSSYQAMLLNDVIMGKTIKLTVSDVSLIEVSLTFSSSVHKFNDNNVSIQPPQGYDSVVGEPGNDLNYDESISESLCKTAH